jgi:hypothetical protein
MSKLEDKERTVKAAREKHHLTNKGKHTRITSDTSAQTLKTRKALNNIIQVVRESNCKPRTRYPIKLSFTLNGEIRTFQDKETSPCAPSLHYKGCLRE